VPDIPIHLDAGAGRLSIWLEAIVAQTGRTAPSHDYGDGLSKCDRSPALLDGLNALGNFRTAGPRAFCHGQVPKRKVTWALSPGNGFAQTQEAAMANPKGSHDE